MGEAAYILVPLLFGVALLVFVICWMGRCAWRMSKPLRQTMRHYADGDYLYNFYAEERQKQAENKAVAEKRNAERAALEKDLRQAAAEEEQRRKRDIENRLWSN
jgi:hypothetical protein